MANGPWKSVGLAMPPRMMARRLGCDVEFVALPAQAYMKTTSYKFDFIFLDGDHRPCAHFAKAR